MYLSHFELTEKPFQLNSDPRFLWPGPRQQEVLDTLRYGTAENKGLLLMTGEVGTGKTTLISALVERLADRVVVARLADPGLTRREFFHFVADGFGIQDRIRTKENFTGHLGGFLEAVRDGGRTALLIVDEAQIMTPGILQEVRLLSNLEVRNRKLLNILLVGQNELLQKLHRPENDAVRKRIAIRCLLEPLLGNETEAYINHRLAAAGCRRRLFAPDALEEIFEFTGGYPRQINILCDLALYVGCEAGADIIDRQILLDCEPRVRIPQQVGPATSVAEDLSTSVPHGAPAPVPPPRKSSRRPVAIGIFLLVLLVPGAILLFGTLAPSRHTEGGGFLKNLRATPAAPWLPQTTDAQENLPPKLLPLPEIRLPSSPLQSASQTKPTTGSPPAVVIIPHRSERPPTEAPRTPTDQAPPSISVAPSEAADPKTPSKAPPVSAPPDDRPVDTAAAPEGFSEKHRIQPSAGSEKPLLPPPAENRRQPLPMFSSEPADRDPAAIFDWLLQSRRSPPKATPEND
ncbi:MAG TPA: AAA family ATPase [Desulfobacterales bacterium]